jgi:FixJ family two-component response regulator
MRESALIAIVDDDDSVRRALVRALVTTGNEVRSYSSAEAFLEDANIAKLSCVISDLRMPGLDGLNLQSLLVERMPHVGIVFLTGHADVSSSVKAMKAGAVDYLEKPVKRTQLVEAVDRAIGRTRAAEADANELRDLQQRYSNLTPRERQVLALVSAGLLNKQIAAELAAAEKTIKQHRGVVMRKMRADSLAELVVMAQRLGVRPSQVDFSKAKGLIRAS